MTRLEIAIGADTEALDVIAESFPNIDIVYKETADSLPYRWEVQNIRKSDLRLRAENSYQPPFPAADRLQAS